VAAGVNVGDGMAGVGCGETPVGTGKGVMVGVGVGVGCLICSLPEHPTRKIVSTTRRINFFIPQGFICEIYRLRNLTNDKLDLTCQYRENDNFEDFTVFT